VIPFRLKKMLLLRCLAIPDAIQRCVVPRCSTAVKRSGSERMTKYQYKGR